MHSFSNTYCPKYFNRNQEHTYMPPSFFKSSKKKYNYLLGLILISELKEYMKANLMRTKICWVNYVWFLIEENMLSIDKQKIQYIHINTFSSEPIFFFSSSLNFNLPRHYKTLHKTLQKPTLQRCQQGRQLWSGEREPDWSQQSWTWAKESQVNLSKSFYVSEPLFPHY